MDAQDGARKGILLPSGLKRKECLVYVNGRGKPPHMFRRPPLLWNGLASCPSRLLSCHSCSSVNAHSNRVSDEGLGLPFRLGFTGSSAMNSAQENSDCCGSGAS